VATNNLVEISGGGVTSWELRLVNSGGTTLESISSSLGLTVNTKLTTNCLGAAMPAAGNILRAYFSGGTPSAGSLKVEGLYRVEAPVALESV
jgi:hypothetical protein